MTRSALEVLFAVLQAAGYKVLHVSDRWLVNDPEGVAAAVRRLLVAP